MYLELQRTDRVRDALEVVALPVGKVVHRVHIPLGARTVVGHLDDAVDDGVAEVHVGRGHIDLGAQDHRPLGELPSVHTAEEVEALPSGTVAVGTSYPRGRRRALLLGDLLGRLLIDVGVTRQDQLLGEAIQALEVVRGVVLSAPLEAQPLDVLADSVDVLHILLGGVGVVEAEVAHAAIALGDTEVHADGLSVADVQVAVGLGWEAGLQASAVLACR